MIIPVIFLTIVPMNYLSLNDALRQQFHTKVYKLSLSSGCSCPNRDGTLGYGGCIFCSEGGSGDFASHESSIEAQIASAKTRINAKFPSGTSEHERRYIAYFQSFTNTYGDPERLYRIFSEAASHPEIVALSIGTRPDCLPPEILQMLEKLNRIKPVWIELGLQTIHEQTADLIHRGYSLPVFDDAYARLKAAGLTVIVHVILGLPGESREDMLDTVRYLSGLYPQLDGIKLQLLHILRGTDLEKLYLEHPFHVMELEEYCELITDCLKLLPKQTVVHRLTGDGPKKLLIAPLWSADKKRVLNTLHRYIREA